MQYSKPRVTAVKVVAKMQVPPSQLTDGAATGG